MRERERERKRDERRETRERKTERSTADRAKCDAYECISFLPGLFSRYFATRCAQVLIDIDVAAGPQADGGPLKSPRRRGPSRNDKHGLMDVYKTLLSLYADTEIQDLPKMRMVAQSMALLDAKRNTHQRNIASINEGNTRCLA